MICLGLTTSRSPLTNNHNYNDKRNRFLKANVLINCKDNNRGLRFLLKSNSKLINSSLSSSSRSREIEIQMAKAATEMILTSGASGRVNALLSMRALRSLFMLINAFIILILFPFRGRRRVSNVVVAAAGSPEKGGGDRGKEVEKVDVISRGKGLPVVRVPSTIVPWKSNATAVEVAARRAIAIRRVTSGGVDDNDKETAREFSMFVTSRGDTMFTQSWAPVSIKIRGLVVILHGLNEHSGRYHEFAKQLNANGYKVYAMDWIGHGGSDGLHAYVHSLDDAVADVKSFIKNVLADNPNHPCFCFGHSTGGAILLKAALDPKIETFISGVVLTSPAVGVQPAHPVFTILAPIFSLLLPRYQLSAANKKGTAVSRDPQALLEKYSDPLVYTGSIRIRTGYEILRITTYLQRNLKEMKVPFLVLHGTADTVTDPAASRKLYEEAISSDKTIKLLEGHLHDLLFEPERKEIMEGIIEWLNCRVQS